MAIRSLRTSLTNSWNVAGALLSLKGITFGSQCPGGCVRVAGVLNAAFHWSPSLMQMLLYPVRRLRAVKSLALANLRVKSSRLGRG